MSSHESSSSGWDLRPPDPWPNGSKSTVAENACGNCHSPHLATGGPRLLPYAAEEAVCAACHNGHVAADNVMADFRKLSIHPMFEDPPLHDPTEPATVDKRHVECVDCHEGMRQEGSRVQVTDPTMQYFAPGYMHVMHALCETCHEERQPTLPVPNENFARCTNCHQGLPSLRSDIWKSARMSIATYTTRSDSGGGGQQ